MHLLNIRRIKTLIIRQRFFDENQDRLSNHKNLNTFCVLFKSIFYSTENFKNEIQLMKFIQ